MTLPFSSTVIPRILCTTWLHETEDEAFLPTPATDDAAGADVRLCLASHDAGWAGPFRPYQQWDGREWQLRYPEQFQLVEGRPVQGDVYAQLAPHSLYRLPLGFRMAIPPHVFALLSPRSSLVSANIAPMSALNCHTVGLSVPHGAGIIDPDYTEEWQLQVSTGEASVLVYHKQKVGQVVLLPRLIGQYVKGAPGADERRRRGGFGSTGAR